MLHALKTIQPYFDEVAAGNKSFEVRKIDRPYMIGDFLALNEWDGKYYTGRFVVARIVYILADGEYVKDGYAILGIVPAEISSEDQLYRFDMVRNKLTRGYQVYGEQRGELSSDADPLEAGTRRGEIHDQK